MPVKVRSLAMVSPSAASLSYVCPTRISDRSLLERYRSLLSFGEQERIASFYFEHDRHDRLVARAMVRTVLSDCAGVAPNEWRFRTNAYGRPEIEAPAEFRSLKFSLSHARGLVACLVAWDRDVGVDIEPIERGDGMLDIADRYFAPAEAAALRELPASDRRRRFLEIWTLKESYVKARGMGLSLPLQQFAFDLSDGPPHEIRVRFGSELADAAARWQFTLEQLGDAHIVATAIERRSDAAVEMTVREVVPLAD